MDNDQHLLEVVILDSDMVSQSQARGWRAWPWSGFWPITKVSEIWIVTPGEEHHKNEHNGK